MKSAVPKPAVPNSGRSRRSAVAKALSLAMLLGLPTAAIATDQLGRLIADTGCGKDMVGRNTFTEEFLDKNSRKRKNPIRMQTANGPVELDSEVTFKINRLQQTCRAVIQ